MEPESKTPAPQTSGATGIHYVSFPQSKKCGGYEDEQHAMCGYTVLNASDKKNVTWQNRLNSFSGTHVNCPKCLADYMALITKKTYCVSCKNEFQEIDWHYLSPHDLETECYKCKTNGKNQGRV